MDSTNLWIGPVTSNALTPRSYFGKASAGTRCASQSFLLSR